MQIQFYKGRTNNHLTWVMVDATDFATPESAMSAATKIKIWGKTRGATTVNFVSSGAGSLTNDIVHVGPSVLGIYTIALVKADLSDASAAWYDQYIISLSATGAAYQTLIADGGIDASAVSGFQSRLSDIASALLVTQSMASDAASAATQANSRVLVVQSLVSDAYSQLSDFRSDLHSFVSTTGVGLHASAISDIRSAIAAGPAATVTASDISDIASAVWANAIGARVDSRVLVNKSAISDIASYLVVMSGVQSDIYSAVSNINSLAIASPTASDIASQTYGLLASQLSDALSAAQQTNSRVILIQSRLSDLDSRLVSDVSDIRSAIAGITVSLDASNISDIASAVVAALPITSMVSDIYSLLSDLQSDFQSRVPKRVATDSQLSDLHSDLRSQVGALAVSASDMSDLLSAATQTNSRALVAQSYLSDIRSHVSDLQSDFQSRVPKRVATDSQLSDLASDLRSVAIVNQSVASDIYSLLSDVSSDLGVMSGVLSDTYSQVSALPADKLTAHAAGVLKLVVGVGSTTTAVKFSTVEGGAASATDDFYNGRVIVFTSGALSGQATSITDYTGATTTATVVALTGAPANAVTAVIV